MNVVSVKAGLTLFIIGMILVNSSKAGADEWVFYAGSMAGMDPGLKLRDWYILNRIKPLPKAGAGAYHYFDRESIGGNVGFPGGIFRVWEKYVIQRETINYEDAKAEVEREEETKLKRKLRALDYAWLFPLVVNRAAKEIQTLFEINCDSREFIILEVNHYDVDGKRMARDVNMDMKLWYSIEPGTIMDALFQQICRQARELQE